MGSAHLIIISYFIDYQLPTDTNSVQEVTSQMSNDDHVYSILRSHYGTISLQDPVRELYGEKIETLAAVESVLLISILYSGTEIRYINYDMYSIYVCINRKLKS